jgi:hypothetical protein
LETGFVAQQTIRAQQSAQLPIAGFTQAGDTDNDDEAICVQIKITLNKMAVRRFTSAYHLSLNNPHVKSFGKLCVVTSFNVHHLFLRPLTKCLCQLTKLLCQLAAKFCARTNFFCRPSQKICWLTRIFCRLSKN